MSNQVRISHHYQCPKCKSYKFIGKANRVRVCGDCDIRYKTVDHTAIHNDGCEACPRSGKTTEHHIIPIRHTGTNKTTTLTLCRQCHNLADKLCLMIYPQLNVPVYPGSQKVSWYKSYWQIFKQKINKPMGKD